MLARIGALGYVGGMSIGSWLACPQYGVVQLVALLAAAILLLLLAVCLPDKQSERLYRWGRLLLGRSEPPSPKALRGRFAS